MDLHLIAASVIDVRGEARVLGSPQQVLRAFERGDLIRLRPGVYVRSTTWSAADARERFAMEAMALHRSRPGTVFLGETALLLQGFDTLLCPATIDVLDVGGGRAGARRVTWAAKGHGASVPGSVPVRGRRPFWSSRETLVVAGAETVPTEVALADVAAHLSFPRALVAADSVARAFPGQALASLPVFVAAVEDMPYGLWTRRGHHVLDLATAASESVGESLSRAIIVGSGFETPELQAEVWDRGHFIARPDYTWRADRIVGEFDGMVKYANPAMLGAEGVAGVLGAERARQRRLEALGWTVVRWEWKLAATPEALAGGASPSGAAARGPATRRRLVAAPSLTFAHPFRALP